MAHLPLMMARQLSHQAIKLAKVPLRTYDGGGPVQPVLGGIRTTLNAIDSYGYHITLTTVVSERMYEYPQQVTQDPRLPESAHRDQIRSNVVYLCIPAPPTRVGRAGLFPL